MIAKNPQGPFEELLAGLSDDDLDRQEDQYEQDISRLNVLLAAVRAAKEARRAMQGDDAIEDGRPATMMDAIAAVMRLDVDRVWSSEDILIHLRRNGWEPKGRTPKNSVDATLSRMVSVGEVFRVSRGLYQLPSAHGVVQATLQREEELRREGGPRLDKDLLPGAPG